MNFWKMNGNGNDFVVITNSSGMDGPALSDLAKRVCRRRRSIGADGVLVVESCEGYDFRMRIFNADGSEGEMCGNGARCIARYAFETEVAGKDMTFDTLAGPMKASVDRSFVRLQMGRIPSVVRSVPVDLPGWSGDSLGDFLTVGVPHLVVYPGDRESFSREDMLRWGRELRGREDLFPQGTNVNFCCPTGEGALTVVTYERGVEDLTDSCGTGSVASAISSVERLGFSPEVVVTNPGGVNRVSLDPCGDDYDVTLGGLALVVAVGIIEEEA